MTNVTLAARGPAREVDHGGNADPLLRGFLMHIWRSVMLALGIVHLLTAGAVAVSNPSLPAEDTVRRRPRPRVVEVSEWYSRRLTIHRWVSYSIIPVFGAQYWAGTQLYAKGRDAPTWAKTTHRAGATSLAGL